MSREKKKGVAPPFRVKKQQKGVALLEIKRITKKKQHLATLPLQNAPKLRSQAFYLPIWRALARAEVLLWKRNAHR